MAVDKRIPRILNSDADSKTSDKMSMNDALNLYSGPDNESFDVNGKKLDAGKDVLKNIRGNVAVPAHPSEGLPEDARVLGSVEDVKSDITYFFVYSENAGNQGVYAYDKKDILSKVDNQDAPLGPPIVRKIYCSSQFNFPQNGFVKGDIVYSSASRSFPNYMGDDFDKDVIIYFTDGANEPRKINAYRAFSESSGQNIHGAGAANQYSEADFITACPKTPIKPIEFVFENDISRSTSNFERTNGFQFAYQHIYKDGVESAISSYSNVAFPPSVTSQGANSFVDHSNFNKCVLSIPESGPEIEKIRLLCRQGNTGSFLIVDEIESGVTSYDFYNDRVLRGVSEAEANKQFDSVPRKAKAQTVSSNRLMYGNYLDGFNKSITTATATVIYKERPEDYLSFDIGYIPSIYNNNVNLNNSKPEGLSFFLDFDQMPDFIPGGTNIDISIEIRPDRNFHIYSHTFSQTRQRGPQPIGIDNNLDDGVNFEQSFSATDDEALNPRGENYGNDQSGGIRSSKIWNPQWPDFNSAYDENSSNIFQNSSIFGPGSNINWNYKGPSTLNNPPGYPIDYSVTMDQVLTAALGSSAANPVIIQGGSVSFSAKLFVPEDIDNAKFKLNQLVRIALTNKNIPSSTFENDPTPTLYTEFGIEILENTAVSSYEFDLGISSGDTIAQPYIGESSGNTDPKCKLINAVAGASKTSESGTPVGFFIFNKGKPTFMLDNSNTLDTTDISFNPYFNKSTDTTSHFSIALVDFANAEPITVLHDTATNDGESGQPATSWIAISNEDLDQYGTNMDSWLDSVGIGASQILGFQNAFSFLGGQGNTTSNALLDSLSNGYGYQLGYISSSVNISSAFSEAQPRYFLQSSVSPSSTTAPDSIFYANVLMDGEGGPGGGPARSENSEVPYDKRKMWDQGSVTVNPKVIFGAGSDEESVPTFFYFDTVFYYGTLRCGGEEDSEGYKATILPFLRRKSSQFSPTSFKYSMPFSDDENSGFLDPESVTFKKNQSTIELTNKSVNFYGLSSSLTAVESFKTEANHNFGIVYYDERGRHGFVDYLTTAFVDGYSNLERGQNKGAVEISLKLEGTPPSWAHSYKIVYGKNSTVENFVQYISGGAFLLGDVDDFSEVNNQSSNIYVSLNYLQGHPISYVSSFGARTPEGGLNMYKFQEGDKLRVISYFNDDSINYVSYEFEVSDLVILGDTDNPLEIGEGNIPENRKGQFLILKNNPEALGFSASDIFSGTNFWNNNCLIEIRTPKKTIDVDEQIYYEVSDYHQVVINPAGDLIHETNPVVVNKGDVWFRSVAANARTLEDGVYEDIIPDVQEIPSDQPSVSSNFINVFMETESANDLFRSDSFSIGRPNVIFEDATETRREATITYSDPSNPESPKIRYSSFNASTANFKDLVEDYGGIQYIGNHDPFIVVIQKEKISMIPVDKQILSDASGNQQLIASLSVLGEVVTYGGINGCDEDPSSVYDSGNTVYFCNKSISKVYRFTRGSGLDDISDIGMSSLIRASLKKAIEAGDQIRIIGGFDKLKEEYLFSISNIPIMSSYGVDEVLQPNQTIFPEEEGPSKGPSLVTNPEITLDFGILNELENIIPRPVIIKNEGDEDLIITGFIIQDEEDTEFELVSFNANVSEDNPMIINPFKSEQILVSFLPRGFGSFSSFLSIISNDSNSRSFDLGLKIFIQENETNQGDGSAVSEQSPFTQAYNDFYGTDLTDQDMSKELAFQYLQDLEGTPGEPTLLDLRNFMDSAENNQTNVQMARFDIDGGQLIDSIGDLLPFLALYSEGYIEGTGMFSGLVPATSTPPLPRVAPPPPDKPKPSTNFKNVDSAINYLLAQNELTVGEYHLLRAQINNNYSLNLNEQGPVNTLDVMQMLVVFYQTTDPDEPAFAGPPLPDQGSFPAGPSSLQTILWLIDDGTMTVGQYFYLASFVKLAAKTDANEDNQITTADLLIMLSTWGFGTEEQPGTSYDLNDLAFNL